MSEHRSRVEREESFLSPGARWWAACSCGWVEPADSRNEAVEKTGVHQALVQTDEEPDG